MLPDDDLMLPGNLVSKVRFLDENPTAGLVHSAFRFLDETSKPFGPTQSWARLDDDTLESGESFMRRALAVGGIVCVSSVMMRSDLVVGEKFNAEDGPYADIALWLRIASRSDVGFLAAPLSGYMVHGGSASSGFQVVQVRGDEHHITSHHADAILQAHGRFVQRGDLSPELREELARLVAEADRRMRLAILANRTLPPNALKMLKRVSGWGKDSLLYKKLSLDSNQAKKAPAAPGSVA
jgi:hypothetical protein